jgi:hypothetical protein
MIKIKEVASDKLLLEMQEKILEKPLLKIAMYNDQNSFNNLELNNFIDIILSKLQFNNSLTLENKLQCEPYRNRSLEDIFLIAKYYRPDITLKEVRKGLFNLLNNCKIATLMCPNINKRVYFKDIFKYTKSYTDCIRCYNLLDEWNLTLI